MEQQLKKRCAPLDEHIIQLTMRKLWSKYCISFVTHTQLHFSDSYNQSAAPLYLLVLSIPDPIKGIQNTAFCRKTGSSPTEPSQSLVFCTYTSVDLLDPWDPAP